MARKGRTNRRKKGDDDENNSNTNLEVLSEDHTIADSQTTDFSSVIDDFDESDNEDYDVDMDELLARGVRDSDNAEAAAASRETKLAEVLNSMDEFASEKRSAKREARLKKLFKGLSQYATGLDASELVASQQNSLRMACLFSLRQGSPAEQYAACRVIEVISVILGADQEDWVDAVAKYLERVVQVISRAVPVRVAALRAWAMAVFVCADDGQVSERLMDYCESVAQEEFRNESTPVALRAAALDCWTLLASTIEDAFLAGQDDAHIGRGVAILNLLKDCLDSGSVELRSAAGQCLSLIHESRLNLGCDVEESENTTERK